MRLSKEELKLIKKVILQIFGSARVVIFGSRLDKKKKGGDIDIFVIPANKDRLLTKKAKAEFILENELYKPIDILIHRDFSKKIEQEALKGIEITGGCGGT